jgi:hypothetical protein
MDFSLLTHSYKSASLEFPTSFSIEELLPALVLASSNRPVSIGFTLYSLFGGLALYIFPWTRKLA